MRIWISYTTSLVVLPAGGYFRKAKVGRLALRAVYLQNPIGQARMHFRALHLSSQCRSIMLDYAGLRGLTLLLLIVRFP